MKRRKLHRQWQNISKRAKYAETESTGSNGHVERLTSDEEAMEGNVKWILYVKYIKIFGVLSFLFSMLLYCLSEVISLLSGLLLATWSDDPEGDKSPKRDIYMSVFAGFGVLEAIAVFFKQVVFLYLAARAAQKIHEELLRKVMHYPMSFFDTTPTGRILNRFSTDIETVDGGIPWTICEFIMSFVRVVKALIIISYSTPIFIVIMIPLSFLYTVLQRFFIPASRQINRLLSLSDSPIFSHFSETITGASSIRAFKAVDRFINKTIYLLSAKNRCSYMGLIASLWFNTRMEMLGNLVIFGASIIVVFSRESISPGLAGLSITYALTITGALQSVLGAFSNLETEGVKVERIFEYKEKEEESSWDQDIDQTLPKDWPQHGHMEIHQLTISYRKGLKPVLLGLTVTIEAGSKVGICGRTGAGKSSLVLALFRMMEAESGSICVDGTDISLLGLQLLRSRLTIIPQDPVLFSNSLRWLTN